MRYKLQRLAGISLIVLIDACGELESRPESGPLGTTSCNDGNPCTDDRWAESLKRCIFVERSDVACDDGDPCTLVDSCLRGMCIGCGSADTPECACSTPAWSGGPYAKIAEELCGDRPE